MAENLSNLKKEIDIQVQEAKRVPNKMNPKRLKPRHVSSLKWKKLQIKSKF